MVNAHYWIQKAEWILKHHRERASALLLPLLVGSEGHVATAHEDSATKDCREALWEQPEGCAGDSGLS
jgi:hypothetical protein